jgi:hypothetical protein
MHGRDKSANKILVRRPERKKPLERPRHRWKDNIKIAFEKYSVRRTDLPGSRQGSVAGCCAHSNESGPMKGKQFLD